jgi:hypothetical protein
LLPIKLIDIFLIWFDHADLHGVETVASCLHQWKVRKLKADIVALLEVIVNGNVPIPRWVGASVLILEICILGVHALLEIFRVVAECKFQDGVLLVR